MGEKPDKQPDWGEGDYASARKYDAEQAAFAKSGKVASKARAAAEALSGPEREALEAARKASAKGRRGARKA